MRSSAIGQLLADRWGDAVLSVLDSMGLGQGTVTSQAEDSTDAAATPTQARDWIWWEHHYTIKDSSFWVGAPAESWNLLSEKTLMALGVESPEEKDLQDTYCDILNQTVGRLSQQLSQEFRIALDFSNVVSSPPPPPSSRVIVTITAPSFPVPISVALVFSRETLEHLDQIAGQHKSQRTRLPGKLADLRFPVHATLGRASMTLGQVCKLSVGSVIGLNYQTADQVEVRVRQELIAKGELVVVKGNYAVKVTTRISEVKGQLTC